MMTVKYIFLLLDFLAYPGRWHSKSQASTFKARTRSSYKHQRPGWQSASHKREYNTNYYRPEGFPGMAMTCITDTTGAVY